MPKEMIAPVVVTGLFAVGGVLVLLLAPDQAATGITLIGAAIANWVTPSARDAREKAHRRHLSERPPPPPPPAAPKPPATPPAPPTAALAVLLALGLGGCAAAQLSAETARVAACEEAEALFEARYHRGELTQEGAFARIDGTRAVCDLLHAKIREAD